MTWSGVECSFDDSKSNQNKEKKGHSQGASTHKSPNLSIHHHFLRSRFTPNTVMKSLKNSNINPENLENLALIIPRDSGLAQSREIRDPVTRLESLGPMKLVSGSNKSLGTYRFDEISTVALGQVLQIEKLTSL